MNKVIARKDKQMELLGAITGIYMRNNRMKEIPIDHKTLMEIVDYIAPFYITLSEYDYSLIKESIKVACKSSYLSKEHKKSLRLLMNKISLFNER